MNKIAFEVPQDYTLTRDRDFLTLVWHIECDSDQTLQTVRALNGVPGIGSRSPLAANLAAVKIRFEMRSPRYFRAHVEYATLSVENTLAGDNLAARAPEIRYFDESELVPLEYCFVGDESVPETPVLNSAGDPFPSPPLIPRLRQRIEIAWYVTRISASRLRSCFNTLNQAAISFDGATYPAQTLWCVRIQSAPHCNAAGTEFTRIELTLRYDPENWNCKILQCGYNAYNSGGEKYPIRLFDGALSIEPDLGCRITEPALLDDSGHLLADEADAVYGEFRFLRLADWSVLGIPNATAVHPGIGG